MLCLSRRLHSERVTSSTTAAFRCEDALCIFYILLQNTSEFLEVVLSEICVFLLCESVLFHPGCVNRSRQLGQENGGGDNAQTGWVRLRPPPLAHVPQERHHRVTPQVRESVSCDAESTLPPCVRL